jgi:hypothetical protein
MDTPWSINRVFTVYQYQYVTYWYWYTVNLNKYYMYSEYERNPWTNPNQKQLRDLQNGTNI